MRLIETTDFLIADLLESKPTNFFILRMPGASKLYAGASSHLHQGARYGYVVADFYGKILTIPAELSKEEIEALPSVDFSYGTVPCDSTPYSLHIENVEEAIKALATFPQRGKVVISSVIRNERKKLLSEIISALSLSYPNAYIFAFRTSETGLWVGASPELLWSQEGETGKTMSLAGTRKSGMSEAWDAKNIEEQKLVTDFICSEIEKTGRKPQVSITETLTAGPVEHLCSKITVNGISPTEGVLLAARLSPTPALSGFPRDNALSVIAKLERHNRDCYGGFSGLYSPHFSNFYATLRCCRLFSSEALLYAGGGITPLSQPESEWTETRMKASTLSNIL